MVPHGKSQYAYCRSLCSQVTLDSFLDLPVKLWTASTSFSRVAKGDKGDWCGIDEKTCRASLWYVASILTSYPTDNYSDPGPQVPIFT